MDLKITFVFEGDFFCYYFYPMNKILLSSAYLGPIQYYSKIAQADQIIIEQYDSYQKQTYRNRCRVLAANGVSDLVIPVVKKSGEKTMMKDVEIDYATFWQNKHWRTIVSAYNSSPFFEYYSDDFLPFFEKKWKYLIDFNSELNALILELLEIETTCNYTKEFIKHFEGSDFRTVISPKERFADEGFVAVKYTQTFDEKYEFKPNLSVIDLLFNVGPESLSVLEETFQ